jgi:putative membrane protein
MLNLDQLPLLFVVLALVLHVLGERRAVRLLGRPRSATARWRSAAFYLALAVTVIALEGPVDNLAPKLLWVHMVQHVLLMGIAAPLIVLGAPWTSIWRPLPLGFRRRVAKAVVRSRPFAPVRAIVRPLGRPAPAWIAFNVDLLAWHIPGAYDLTLRSQPVHVLEHITFLIFGVLVWAQMIDSPPLRSRLGSSARVYYCVSAMVPGWLLSLVLAFASRPLYSVYANLSSRPGGISALVDQQLAGGVMLGLGSLASTVYVFFALYRWLGEDPEHSRGGSRVLGDDPEQRAATQKSYIKVS